MINTTTVRRVEGGAQVVALQNTQICDNPNISEQENGRTGVHITFKIIPPFH